MPSLHPIPFAALTLATVTVLPCLADHGPGTSGSGFTTQTAETLKKKQWSVAAHFDWTEFDSVDSSRLVGLEHFDLLDRSFLTTFGLSYGVTNNFEVGISFGYYTAEGAREIPHDHDGGHSHDEHAEAEGTEEHEHAEATETHAGHEKRPRRVRHAGHGHEVTETAEDAHDEAEEAEETEAGDSELASFDPDGWTDVWFNAKYRVYEGPAGKLSIYGGIKFPVGLSRVYDSAGHRVEPASTPGTGAWDEMVGLAYTFIATPTLSFDASAQYTFRGEKFDYRLGNRFDAGLSAGWRVYGTQGNYPQVNLQGEISVRHLEKSEEHGADSEDTGGTALFLSPGLRVAFSPHTSWSAGVQLPVVQDLNGNQVETSFRVVTGLSVSF